MPVDTVKTAVEAISNSDTAKEILAKSVKVITDYLSASVEFVKEQAPDVANQIIAWGAAQAIFWTVVGAVMIVAATIGWTLVIKFSKKPLYDNYHSWSERQIARFVPTLVLSIFFTIAGIASVITNLQTYLMIQYAPKVYLLMYLKDLIK